MLPDIPKTFSISSDTLYQFLASPLNAEGSLNKSKRRSQCKIPTQSFIKMLEQKPEERAISELTQKIQNNTDSNQNLTHQLPKKRSE